MTDPACAALARDLRALASRLDGKRRTEILKETGEELKPTVAEATRREIGHIALSRWFGGKTDITGEVMNQSDGSIAVQPRKVALGPMSVLSYGRRAYTTGDRRNSGRYISKKTGKVTQKTRVVKRAGGASRGKGTWADAEKKMAADAPAVFEGLILKEVLKVVAHG